MRIQRAFHRLACSSSPLAYSSPVFAFCFLLFASFALPLSAASVVTSPSGRTISVKLDAPQASALSTASAVSTPAAATASALSVIDRAGAAFGVTNAAAQLRVIRTDTDIRGATHVRCEQIYKGLRVLGGSLAVHFRKTGAAYEVDGQFVTLGEIDITPKVTAEAAVATARARHAGALVAAPELVIYARLSCAAAPRLAWTFSLRETPTRIWLATVDARTGAILDCYNNVKRAAPVVEGGLEQLPSGHEATLTGPLQYVDGGGTTNLIGWVSNDGDYFLYSTNLSWAIGYYPAATNAEYATDETGAVENTPWWLVRSTNSAAWTSTVWGGVTNNFPAYYKFFPSLPSQIEFGVAVDTDRTLTYFRDVHGWNGWDGNGALLQVSLYLNAVDNAYWSGEHMVIGFGRDAMDPGTLDTLGHETTHAVTQTKVPPSGLTYQGESGALNESFSDVFGACVEFYWQPDGRDAYPTSRLAQADWLFGEDDCSDQTTTKTAFRDMRNPMSTALNETDRQPSRRFGTYWHTDAADNGGVHGNSGVQNFFFYLLCEGGHGFNDGAIPYDVTGVGLEDGEQIAFAAQGHCAPDDTYSEMPARWLSGAADVADGDAAKFAAYSNAVVAAWAAVLTVPPTGTNDDLKANLPGDSFITSKNNSITLSTTNANGIIYWTLDGSLPSPTNANAVVFTNGAPISLSTVDQTIRAAVYDAASNRLTDVAVLAYVDKANGLFNCDNWYIPYSWIGNYNPGLKETPAAYRAWALEDSDGDGYTNYVECVCGSDPTNAASFLRAVIGFDADGNITVSSSCSNTAIKCHTTILGTMTLTSMSDSYEKLEPAKVAATTNRFFRVRLDYPEDSDF